MEGPRAGRGTHPPARRWRRRVLPLVAPAAVVAALGLLPPVQARVKALAVLAESLRVPWPRPLAPVPSRTDAVIGGARGDLYSPGPGAPGLVLVHGAAPKGRNDPRLVRVAYALAKAGREVFVPALELADRRFTRADVDRIAASITGMADRTAGDVSVFGISYGGSFALMAAADPAVSGHIRQLAIFGAYYDILGVIQAATTGVSLVDGRRIPWTPDPRADEVLERYSLRLAPSEQRDQLRAALDGRLDAARLPAEARAVHELLTNRDPERTYEIARSLDSAARAFLNRYSPSAVAQHIRVPVIALHSVDDPVVPYGESLRIVDAIPGTRLATVKLFRHVDFGFTSLPRALPDLFDAWRFTSWMLSAQE